MPLKREVTITLFIFFVVVISILTVGLIFYNQNKVTPLLNANGIATSTNNLGSGVKVGLTINEIAKHNTANDCWMIINNNVYNLSSFLNQHPAGSDIMIPYCGKDGTQAFATKGGKGDPHSSQAQAMLPNYLIGQVGQTTTGAQIQTTSNIKTNITSGGEQEREFEDD